MLGTLGGAIVALLIVLPGAAYTWGFEQAVSGWGAGLADRTVRFAAGSAVFAVITAPLTFWFYAEQVASGRLAHGEFWWPSWPLSIGYVVVPFVAGRVVGRAVQLGRRWPALLVGPAPAPRAWDHVFLSGPQRLCAGPAQGLKRGDRWLGSGYLQPAPRPRSVRERPAARA